MAEQQAMRGACHCGAVTMTVPGRPEWLGSCNCSICSKLGTLFAYYPDDGGVTVSGETARYIWGDKMIALHHCPTCGCPTHWDSLGESFGKVGINARLLDGFAVVAGEPRIDGEAVEVRFLDNAG